jgi:hypothetical protein
VNSAGLELGAMNEFCENGGELSGKIECVPVGLPGRFFSHNFIFSLCDFFACVFSRSLL